MKSNLLHVLKVIKHRPVPNVNPFRSGKDAALELRGFTPISGAPYTSIVLTDWFVQLDSHPSTKAAGLVETTPEGE